MQNDCDTLTISVYNWNSLYPTIRSKLLEEIESTNKALNNSFININDLVNSSRERPQIILSISNKKEIQKAENSGRYDFIIGTALERPNPLFDYLAASNKDL